MIDAAPTLEAPAPDGAMMFVAPFDLDAALTPQSVPLHVQWWLEDMATYAHGLLQAHEALRSATLQLVLLAACLIVWLGWRWSASSRAYRARLRVIAEDAAEAEARITEQVALTQLIRDAIIQRRYGEASYQAERALEGW